MAYCDIHTTLRLIMRCKNIFSVLTHTSSLTEHRMQEIKIYFFAKLSPMALFFSAHEAFCVYHLFVCPLVSENGGVWI